VTEPTIRAPPVPTLTTAEFEEVQFGDTDRLLLSEYVAIALKVAVPPDRTVSVPWMERLVGVAEDDVTVKLNDACCVTPPSEYVAVTITGVFAVTALATTTPLLATEAAVELDVHEGVTTRLVVLL
jgi:hypothetical protein